MNDEYKKARKRIENIYYQGSNLINLSEEDKEIYNVAAKQLLQDQMTLEDYKKAMYTAEKALYLATNAFQAGCALDSLLVSASRNGFTKETIYYRDGHSSRRLQGIPGGLGRELLDTLYMNDPSYPFAVPLLLILSVLLLAVAVALIFNPEIAILIAGTDGMNVVYAAIAVTMIVSVLLFNNQPFQVYKAGAVTVVVGVILVVIAYTIPNEMLSRFSPSLGFLVAAIVACLGYSKMKKYQKRIDNSFVYAEKVYVYAKKLLENARSGRSYSTLNIPEYLDLYCKAVDREISFLEKGLAKRKK